MKRVLGFILGILMCIGGVYCLANPTITFEALTLVLGITLIESAIAYFIVWLKLKKAGGGNALLLVNSILSIIAGIGSLTDYFAQFVVESMMLIMIAVYVTAMGIVGIVNSFKIKKTVKSSLWIWILISGILILIAGIISIINPLALEITIGILIAMDIFTIGINLIVISLAFKK